MHNNRLGKNNRYHHLEREEILSSTHISTKFLIPTRRPTLFNQVIQISLILYQNCITIILCIKIPLYLMCNVYLIFSLFKIV